MSSIVLYPLLSTALFYLGSRAMITQWLWSRYPPRLARFADCSACTGFWWGLILALVLGRHEHLNLLELDAEDFWTPIVAGLCSMVWTPIVAGVMQRGFDSVGSAVADPPTEFPVKE